MVNGKVFSSFSVLVSFILFNGGIINESYAAGPIPILNPTFKYFLENYPDDTLDFSVLGDWGFPGQNQTKVANALKVTTERFNSKFIINVGDSFYVGGPYTYDGVSNSSDPKFNTIWKATYTGALANIPWYSVAGNHEWYNNVTAEVDYSLTKDARFFLPALYYTRVSLVGPNKAKIAWIHIDTDPFYYTDLVSLKQSQPAMYNSLVQQGWDKNDNVEKLLGWIETELIAHQDSRWIFVVGHHPLVASCKNTGNMTRLSALFENYHVSAYFSGHAHTLEYQAPSASEPVSYFISGSGSKLGDTCDGRTWGDLTPGFLHISLTASNKTANFQYIDASDTTKTGGSVVYSGSIPPRNLPF
ncbi:3990_t:CDS:2 [Ambispora leptoticha]|uniref:3990_t:CDS:1 n=1 Tax=Ambispora leptoticha TaxID=144679 RepID=A0A9N9A436_9GLOM|nr:3990_t:CDS:2 [Ambispora leptoticha]